MKAKKNSDFKIGEIVVYPKHGVGEIEKIESMKPKKTPITHIKSLFGPILISGTTGGSIVLSKNSSLILLNI